MKSLNHPSLVPTALECALEWSITPGAKCLLLGMGTALSHPATSSCPPVKPTLFQGPAQGFFSLVHSPAGQELLFCILEGLCTLLLSGITLISWDATVPSCPLFLVLDEEALRRGR